MDFNEKILEGDDVENKIVPIVKKNKNPKKTGRYLQNKFVTARLRRDLRNHPEYIHLVAYIEKIINRKNMQIKRLKRKFFLFEEKAKILNVDKYTQTENVSSESEKSKGPINTASLLHTGEDAKCNQNLSHNAQVFELPSLLREKAELSTMEQSTQTEYDQLESRKSDSVDLASFGPTVSPTKSREHLGKAEHNYMFINECKSFNVEQSTQTENEKFELNESAEVNAATSWHSGDTTKPNKQLSIAEQVKQVAENVISDAGMVYVESAGMYYDSKSGYYYSPELGLYYHNTTGCYYYFNEEKNEFCYYSHANSSQQNPQDNNEQHMLVQHQNNKKLSSRKKQKKEKRVGSGESEKRKASRDPSLNKRIKKDDTKTLSKSSGRRKTSSQENRKKAEMPAKESGEFIEKCHDENPTKKDKKVNKEVEDSEGNQDPASLTQIDTFSHNVKTHNVENGVDSEVEDGECSSSATECHGSDYCSVGDHSSSASSSSDDSFDETVAKHHPPCIRMIVKESSLERLDVGSLYIVTKDGGSLGREGIYHSVILPDQNVSRHHLTFRYDIKNKCYDVTDVGSQNGTILNGKRMSPAKQESERMKLVHGSTLTVGGTTLLCHVHDGHDTCGHCEPGLIKTQNEEKERKAYKPATNLRKQYKQELQRLRSKYAGGGESGETGAGGEEGTYRDRAAARRQTVGSSHSAEKTEQGDLNVSITQSNKGFKMLEKMGWSKGEGLGKKRQGDTDPVPLVSNEGSSGLGAGGVGTVSVAPAMWRPRPRPQAVAKVFRQNDDDED